MITFRSLRQLSTVCILIFSSQLVTFGQETKQTQVEVSAGLAASAHKETNLKEEKRKREKRGSIVIAPIPISSPAIGSGVVPVIGYIFPISKKDKISPPSVIGGGGLITNNGSRAFGLAAQLYFKQNRYKSTVFYGHGNLDYNLYGSGASSGLKLPLIQTGEAFQAEFLRRTVAEFFLGPRVSTGTSVIRIAPTNSNVPPLPPDVGLHTHLTALGLQLSRDTSPNRFYPTSGTFFTFTSDFYGPALGSKYTLQSYRGSFNKYWSLNRSQVIAYDGYGCATGGKPPFYMNCIYGSGNELRGYTAGKYFDRYMVTSQVEYRLALPYRLGVVGFGGIGEAIPGNDQLLFRHNDFLPAGGVGLRLLLSEDYHVNLRSDFAWGKDGSTFSLGIGEAF